MKYIDADKIKAEIYKITESLTKICNLDPLGTTDGGMAAWGLGSGKFAARPCPLLIGGRPCGNAETATGERHRVGANLPQVLAPF